MQELLDSWAPPNDALKQELTALCLQFPFLRSSPRPTNLAGWAVSGCSATNLDVEIVIHDERLSPHPQILEMRGYKEGNVNAFFADPVNVRHVPSIKWTLRLRGTPATLATSNGLSSAPMAEALRVRLATLSTKKVLGGGDNDDPVPEYEEMKDAGDEEEEEEDQMEM